VSGEVATIAESRARAANDVVRDSEAGLTMKRRIVRYTNDRVTKAFLEREATRLVPDLRLRRGARYRLNRWREERIAHGARIEVV
jgi:hypothetical protein